MSEKTPLYIVGLSKDEPANEVLYSKFGAALEKVQPVLSNIIEAKLISNLKILKAVEPIMMSQLQ